MYISNEKNYILQYNKQFLRWYRDRNQSGYLSFLDIQDMQRMVDYIAFWYETKIPERDFIGMSFYNFDVNNDLKKCMTFEQLMYRLDIDVYDFLRCGYRIQGNDTNVLIFQIMRKNEIYTITADSVNGRIIDLGGLDSFTNNDELTIEGLFALISNNKLFEISELRKIIKIHKIDLELRAILLNLVSMKILSNNIVSDEVRMCRYKTFVKEFNEKINGLNINVESSPEKNIKVLMRI